LVVLAETISGTDFALLDILIDVSTAGTAASSKVSRMESTKIILNYHHFIFINIGAPSSVFELFNCVGYANVYCITGSSPV